MENGWQAGQGTRWGWMEDDGKGPVGGWIEAGDRRGKMVCVDKGWKRWDGVAGRRLFAHTVVRLVGYGHRLWDLKPPASHLAAISPRTFL